MNTNQIACLYTPSLPCARFGLTESSPVDPGLHQNCQICPTQYTIVQMYKAKFQEESVLDDGLIDGTDAIQTSVL